MSKRIIGIILIICFILSLSGIAFSSPKWTPTYTENLFTAILVGTSFIYLFFKILIEQPPVNPIKEVAIDEIMYICNTD